MYRSSSKTNRSTPWSADNTKYTALDWAEHGAKEGRLGAAGVAAYLKTVMAERTPMPAIAGAPSNGADAGGNEATAAASAGEAAGAPETVAARIMRCQGWRPGQGLGAAEDGSLEPMQEVISRLGEGGSRQG